MLLHFTATCLIAVGTHATAVPGELPGRATPPVPLLITPLTPLSPIAGQWSGVVKVPGVELKIQVFLAHADGKWIGTIDIPQQGAKALPLEEITVKADSVGFRIANVPGTPTFKGTHSEGKIAGDLTQGGQTFPFDLARGGPAKPKRPQNPVAPFPYGEHELTVTSGEAILAGTLTVPRGEGPFPAVILVSGSGPQNRDEELFEHRPFAVWADHLSRAGIAVLRYDDRGVGASTGDFAAATTRTLASDAEAWVKVLKSRPDIRSVGIMGHSEGGIIGPMVAARNPDVRFVVMLAGPGVNGAEVLIEQNRSLALAAGATAEASEKIAAAAREAFKAFADKADDATIRARITDLVNAQTGGTEVTDASRRAVDQAIAGLRTPWFAEFLAHDPAPDLRKVRVPVLAIFGERDVQVVPSQNLGPVEAALKAGGNTRATAKVIPGVNHMFQKCSKGGVDEYGTIETTIDPAVIELVQAWILANADAAN